MTPKVFMSHASDDKERFVIPFATKLQARGIDVWLDKWEMLPGDSLVDKIFEEGIKEADAFIIVLSAVSILKPWVREELNASFIKRLDGKCKIIPVVIDEIVVPECLKSTVWERIESLDDYEDSIERIVNAVFGHRTKPPIGQPPKYIQTDITEMPGLNRVDTIVLQEACKLAIDCSDAMVNSANLFDRINAYEITETDFFDTLKILDSKGMIRAEVVLRGEIPCFFLTTQGFDIYCRTNITDFERISREAALAIVNHGLMDSAQISSQIGQPTLIVEHILEIMKENSLLKLSRTKDRTHIFNVSPALKRNLSI